MQERIIRPIVVKISMKTSTGKKVVGATQSVGHVSIIRIIIN